MFKASRPVQFYYSFMLMFMAITIGLGINYYWNTGSVNIENISTVFEANLMTEDLQKRNDLKKIRLKVGDDRVRDAIKSLDKLESDVKKLNTITEVKGYEKLEKDLSRTRESMNKLISFPELSTVVSVLSNKVSNFESFVVQNRWRTLTRMARRIKAKVSPQRVSSPGFFKYSKINKVTQSINKDINVMISVTEGSVLTRSEKTLILTKVKTLKTEVKMLERYVKVLRSFNTKLSSLEKTYGLWFKDLQPEIMHKRIQFERDSQNLLLAMIVLVATLLLVSLLGLVVYKVSSKKNEKKMESLILEAVKEGIVPLQNKFEVNMSENGRADFEKYRDYIHKRMSFGTIFQDAMPFSSVLLDSNLNMVWANSQFYENWKLEEGKSTDSNINWDHLQRFTNLGENDPIITALKDDVAGIYQIQLKPGHDAESLPYEMYVSPVEYAGQKRIMVFFYPLRSLEETISNQMTSIVGPVARTLDTMCAHGYDKEFKEKIVRDFEIAGIPQIFTKFQSYFEIVNQQKTGLFNEIERLENELYDSYKLVDDMRAIHGQKKELNKIASSKFNETKDAIISIVEMRNEMESLYQHTLNTTRNLFHDEQLLLSHANNVNEILTESEKAFVTVGKVRDDFKQLKSKVDQFRGRILQLLDQSLIFQRNDENGVKAEQSLGKIKTEIKAFEKTLSSLSQVSTGLDVGLSKVSLIMSHKETPDLSGINEKFEDIRDKIDNDIFNLNRITRNGQTKDEEMIKSLKGLYSVFKEGSVKLKDLEVLAQVLETQREYDAHASEIDLELEVDEPPLADQTM